MNILLDHCVPRPFGRLLPGHDVKTAHSVGFGQLTNGALLQRAAADFDVVITVDASLQYQQNPATLPIALIALQAVSNTVPSLAPLAPQVLALLEAPLDRRVYVVRLAE